MVQGPPSSQLGTEDDTQLLQFHKPWVQRLFLDSKLPQVTFKAATVEFISGVSLVELTWNALCTAIIHTVCAVDIKLTD